MDLTARTTRRAPGRRLSAVLVAIVAAAATACLPPDPPAGWHQHYLSRDAGDVARIRPVTGGMAMRAASTNGGSNSRTVFGRSDSVVGVDQTNCATATHTGWPNQEGVALRIAVDSPGGRSRVRAVTVTKNVAYHATWAYNVHTWDTHRPGDPFRMVQGFDMSGAVTGDSHRSARRLCARVRGRELTFKVWRAGQPEPSWTSPTHARTVTLPAGWDHAGRPGWYGGHVPAGGSITFTGLHTEVIPK